MALAIIEQRVSFRARGFIQQHTHSVLLIAALHNAHSSFQSSMNPPPPPPSVSFAPIPPPPAPIIPQAPSQNRDIENGQLARSKQIIVAHCCKLVTKRKYILESEEAAIEKIINKFTAEREISDRKQLLDIRTSLNELLSDWSKKLNDVFVQQQQQIHEHKNNDHSVASIDAVVGDMRERQAKIVEAMQDAHNKQVEVLRAAISDERKESAQTQLVIFLMCIS